LDFAPAQSAALKAPAVDTAPDSRDQAIQSPALSLTELSGLSVDDFWREARADSVDLTKDELATVLLALGIKYHYGLAPGTAAGRAQIAAFWRGLQFTDLALAHACALGRDSAWRQFMTRFRDPLTRAAIAITGSASSGEELADSLYSEMFGLTERDGHRQSPLAHYSGRGSLMGFLRATLAQRNVDRHRRTSRETPLPSVDLPADPLLPAASPDVLSRLREALNETLGVLPPEERFLLSAWFLDRRTLLEISRILRVHEATVSRRLHRLTSTLHNDLLKRLQASGMSRAAAAEALGTDPRDLDINLRTLLQSSRSSSFPDQGVTADTDAR
jgi:RNA polymerase sigma-70 factor (ECF subfamily)